MSLNNFLDRREALNQLKIIRLKDRSDPFEDLSSKEFKIRFRFEKETVLNIISLIKSELLGFRLKRGVYLPLSIKILVALRFYATGSFQLVVGDIYKLSQSTVCKIVSKVSQALAKLRCQFIKFPSFDEANTVRRKFFSISGFPGVVGAIDCTHIYISSPGGEDGELFRNRYRKFSINVQAICDSELLFTNIVARWYGSAHDSRIFDNSSIKDSLEENSVPWLLVGDQGYALKPYLMTPFSNPDTLSKKRYNKSQIKARNPIERAFGVLKKRFSCLKYSRLKLSNTLTVIVATVILHNIARQKNDIYRDDEYDIENEDELYENQGGNSTLGNLARLNIVNSHFM